MNAFVGGLTWFFSFDGVLIACSLNVICCLCMRAFVDFGF